MAITIGVNRLLKSDIAIGNRTFAKCLFGNVCDKSTGLLDDILSKESVYHCVLR